MDSDVPTMASVFLRMGWSLGDVQKRYIFEGAGSDQLLGRCCSALNINDLEFAVLPPHFDHANFLQIEELNDIVYGFLNHLEGFKLAIPYLIASVVYHSEWLATHLPAYHPYFTCALYRNGYVARLKPHVLLGQNKCTLTGLAATGIPPHLAVAYRVLKLEEQLRDQERSHEVRHNLVMAAARNLQADLPALLIEELRRYANVEGHPVSIMDKQNMLERQMAPLMQRVEAMIAQQPMAAQPNEGHLVQDPLDNGEPEWIQYFWNEQWITFPKAM